VGHVADQVEDADWALGAAEPEDHLVREGVAHGLHGHLTRVEEMGHRLRHGEAEEVARRRMHVVEVPTAAGQDPQLQVLAQRAGDAAPALDEGRPRRTELGQADTRAWKPELAELREAFPVHHRTRSVHPRSARTLSRAPLTRSRSFSCLTSMVRVDSTRSRSRASAFRITSERAP